MIFYQKIKNKASLEARNKIDFDNLLFMNSLALKEIEHSTVLDESFNIVKELTNRNLLQYQEMKDESISYQYKEEINNWGKIIITISRWFNNKLIKIIFVVILILFLHLLVLKQVFVVKFSKELRLPDVTKRKVK